MWDLETGRKTVDIPAHNGDVVSISVAPDGKTFVTGSVDKTCRLWDVREKSPKQTFFGHESDVNSVCVSNKVSALVNLLLKNYQYLVLTTHSFIRAVKLSQQVLKTSPPDSSTSEVTSRWRCTSRPEGTAALHHVVYLQAEGCFSVDQMTTLSTCGTL